LKYRGGETDLNVLWIGSIMGAGREEIARSSEIEIEEDLIRIEIVKVLHSKRYRTIAKLFDSGRARFVMTVDSISQRR